MVHHRATVVVPQEDINSLEGMEGPRGHHLHSSCMVRDQGLLQGTVNSRDNPGLVTVSHHKVRDTVSPQPLRATVSQQGDRGTTFMVSLHLSPHLGVKSPRDTDKHQDKPRLMVSSSSLGDMEGISSLGDTDSGPEDLVGSRLLPPESAQNSGDGFR